MKSYKIPNNERHAGKLDARITKTVMREVNGIPEGGYVEVKIKFGKEWRVLFFRLVKEEI